MMKHAVRLVARASLIGLASGGAAFLFVFLTSELPVKLHAGFLAAVAILSAITEAHFRSLLSELGALLRRSSFSVGQLEQLNQSVPELQHRASFAWGLSMVLKACVALVGTLLLSDTLNATSRPVVMFLGYTFLLWSFALALWARHNARALESIVQSLTFSEAAVKEKRRLKEELKNGKPHDFKKDKLAQGYTKPA